EGSTKMWEDDPEAMASAVAKHDELIGSAVRRAGGQLVKSRGEGDSCFCVFTRTDQAAAAAMAIQRGLAARMPARGLRLRARMAIHCGLAELRGGDYYGPVVNRVARLRATAFGEQVLLSAAAADAVQNA